MLIAAFGEGGELASKTIITYDSGEEQDEDHHLEHRATR